MSRDYHALVKQRDPGALAFDPQGSDPQAQWLRVLNGSLTPLVIGLAWDSAGYSVEELNGPWRWGVAGSDPGAQWRFNVAHGNRPSAALLARARLPSAWAAAASVALVYVLALALSGSRLAAGLAVAVYATTPAVLLNGRRAMQEGPLLLSTALVVWAAWGALRARPRSGSGQGSLPWLLALAAACGLALATKHSGGVVVAAALLAIGIAPWLQRSGDAPQVLTGHVASLAGVALGALAVWLLLTPVWWSLPRSLALVGLAGLAFGLRAGWRSRRAWLWRGAALAAIAAAWLARPGLPGEAIAIPSHVLEARRPLLERQVERFAGAASPGRRLTILLGEAFLAEPQFFEDPAWAEFPEIQRQIEAYRGSLLSGRGGGWAWGAPLAALCAMGCVAAWRRRRDPEIALLAAWLAIPAVVLLANPLPWQRYYLSIHAPLAVLAGLGAAALPALRRG